MQSNAVQGISVASLAAAFPGSNTAGNLILAFVRMSTSTDRDPHRQRRQHLCRCCFADTNRGWQPGAPVLRQEHRGRCEHGDRALFGQRYSSVACDLRIQRPQHRPRPLIKKPPHRQQHAPNTGATPITTSANELVFVGAGLPSTSTITVTGGSGCTPASRNQHVACQHRNAFGERHRNLYRNLYTQRGGQLECCDCHVLGNGRGEPADHHNDLAAERNSERCLHCHACRERRNNTVHVVDFRRNATRRLITRARHRRHLRHTHGNRHQQLHGQSD